MDSLYTHMMTGFTAFTATNLDDILILLLFFSQVNQTFRKQHIVFGQYLGFATLVAISLSGFFGSLMFPRPWIGILGVVPIVLGINRLLNPDQDDDYGTENSAEVKENASWLDNMLSPQVANVAAITVANGGDNIGIYVPLFASNTWESLIIILAVFFSLVGVWCYTAYKLTKLPVVAETLTRYGSYLVPFVLVGLGFMILIDSHTLENRGLTVLTLLISALAIFKLQSNDDQAVGAMVQETEKG